MGRLSGLFSLESQPFELVKNTQTLQWAQGYTVPQSESLPPRIDVENGSIALICL